MKLDANTIKFIFYIYHDIVCVKGIIGFYSKFYTHTEAETPMSYGFCVAISHIWAFWPN